MRPFQPKPLSERLADCGCAMDPDAFKAVVREVFRASFPEYDVDRAMCEPSRMIALCVTVRDRIDHSDLPEFVICWTLYSMRKSGELDSAVEAA